MSAADLGLIVSVFFASAVEFVEALTIVQAMGITRGRRSALEGLEIVFIVITFGLNADNVPLAAAGAAAAGAIVLAIGAAAHRPLANVPQNRIKFAVGLLLSTFGTFWAVEGLGWFSESGESLGWPGGDFALLALLGAWAAFSAASIRVMAVR